MIFKPKELTRRRLFGASTNILCAAVSVLEFGTANAVSTSSSANEAIVRQYYKLWEINDWSPMDRLLASTFTFTSAAGDDHISKSEYKTRCWDTQIGNTKRFELLHLIGGNDDAFVMYIGHTKNKRSFRNVEYLRVRDSQVQSIECYFGQKNSFPTAVSWR